MDLGDPLELFEDFDECDRDEDDVNTATADVTMILKDDLYYLESKVRDCVISPDRAK